MKKVFVVGTCDTKYQELTYVRDIIRNQGLQTVLVHIGSQPAAGAVDVDNHTVAVCHAQGGDFLKGIDDRGKFVELMAQAFAEFLKDNLEDVAGIISLGGSGGTSLATQGMRVLPIGVPKIMVSTVASGNVAPYVGPNDIAMMYSVTDVAGVNSDDEP